MYPFADSTLLQKGVALLKVVLLVEILLICFEILFGNTLIILGGCFKLTLK